MSRSPAPVLRRGRNTRDRIADIGMAAFPVFFMLSPSFLAHQRKLERTSGRSNCLTPFGMDCIPSDNHIRKILDPAPPENFDNVFINMVRDLEARGALRSLHRNRFGLEHPSTLIALDGSEYVSPYAINCSTHTRNRGTDRETAEYVHSFLAAAIVTPERNLALPLPPEIIRPQDGNDKQDCERNALKRWLGCIAPGLCRRRFARLPAHLRCHLQGRGQLHPHRQATRPFMRKITRRVHGNRWVEDVPVRSGAGAFRVTWIGHEISDPAAGKVGQSFARITNLPVDCHDVREIAECGRARWKVGNNGFNVSKQSCNLDRNFWHGSENPAPVLPVPNLPAFAMHTACDLAERAWQDARRAAGSRGWMFRQLQVLTARIIFETWRQVLDVVADKIEARPWPDAGQPLQGSQTHQKTGRIRKHKLTTP